MRLTSQLQRDRGIGAPSFDFRRRRESCDGFDASESACRSAFFLSVGRVLAYIGRDSGHIRQPIPTRLPETPRKSFIEEPAFEKLHAAIKEPGLRALCLTAYRLGFRKSELQNVLVMQLDGGWLRLFAGGHEETERRGPWRCLMMCVRF
jgi:hypothetical protein